MSETSILPGAGAATESDADLVPPGTGVDEVEGGGDRRRLMIAGAVAGLVVLVVAAYLLLHGGSSSASQPFVPIHAAGPSAPPAAGHEGTKNGGHGGKPTTLPKKAKHSSLRDPFDPLVQAPVATSGGPSSTTTVKAPAATDTTAPGTTASAPAAPSAPASPPPTGTSTTPNGNGPKWIELKSAHGRTAVFDVGYRHHKFRRFVVQAPSPGSRQGTVFDKIFALLGVQNHQATVQIGDDTPFDLAKGVAHVV